MTHEQGNLTAEKIYMGPFFGSDRPNTIVSSTEDASSQIIWKQPGAQVNFDSEGVDSDDQYMRDYHGAVVYRLAGEGESVTDVVYAPNVTLVVNRANRKSKADSVRAYQGSMGDRKFQPPQTVKIGENISLLSDSCKGSLFSVVELVNPPDDTASADHAHPRAEDMLNGFRGSYGGEYDYIEHTKVRKPSEMLQLITEATTEIERAAHRAAIMAIQANGVVIR